MIHKKVTYYDDEGFEFNFEPLEDTLSIKKTEDGYEAKYLIRDEFLESPDSWEDEGVFLVNYHRDFWVTRDQAITKDEARAFYQGEKIEQEKDFHIFLLTSCIHSGVMLFLGDHPNPTGMGCGHFDTSHVGLVLVSKKETRYKTKARELARNLIDTWNQYLSGDVYCCVRENYDKDKEPMDLATLGGVFGFDEALEALKDAP